MSTASSILCRQARIDSLELLLVFGTLDCHSQELDWLSCEGDWYEGAAEVIICDRVCGNRAFVGKIEF